MGGSGLFVLLWIANVWWTFIVEVPSVKLDVRWGRMAVEWMHPRLASPPLTFCNVFPASGSWPPDWWFDSSTHYFTWGLSHWAVHLPLWFLAAVAAMPAAFLSWSAHRRARRLGLCPHCDYDLRGGHTGGTCPECGAPAAPRVG